MRLIVCLCLFAVPFPANADAVILTPVADTTLIEEAPSNNAGGMTFVNAGTTQNYTRNRGLLRFDPASIPPGSTVTNVSLSVEVIWRPKDGFNAATFELHRLLRPWGEGSETLADPNHPGLGAPAVLGEATWTAPFALTTNLWAAPGGQPGTDFAPNSSSESTVYGLEDSPYTFLSTPQLVADVQAWIQDPQTNYGWLLTCQDESLNFTARRFASREDPARAPQLQIDFTPPIRIAAAGLTNGAFVLQFTAQAGQAYSVEYRDSLAGTAAWVEWANFPPAAATTNIVLTQSVSGATRFFRLRRIE